MVTQNNDYNYCENNAKIHKTAILVNTKLGSNCIIAPYVIINDNCEIGDNTIVGPFNVLEHGVKVGKNVTIGPHGVFAIDTVIEDNCFFGPHFSCANDKNISHGEHGTSKNKAPFVAYPITFKEGCRIGTRCTIAPGVTIGEGAKVDMCSFVIKNVRAFSHIRGDPKFVATELR